MEDTCDKMDEAPATVPTGPDARARVVAAAAGELGARDPMPYWESARLGDVVPSEVKHLAWCGAFVLWALHQAELAPGWRWEFGPGFLYRLHITREPKPGDVAYFEHLQHHALVESVDEAAGIVALINGNGAGGAVTRSHGPRGLATAYYSIEPLIAEVQS